MRCRARPPFRAIFERSTGVSDTARAAPPITPPVRPLSTSFASFPSSTASGTWPVMMSTMSLPSWTGSRGREVRFIVMALYPSSVEPVGFRLCKLAISERQDFYNRPRLTRRCTIGNHDYPLWGLLIGEGAHAVDFHTAKMA